MGRLHRAVPGAILVLLFAFPSLGRACDQLPPPEAGKQEMALRLDPRQSQVRFDAKAFLHTFAGTTHKLEGSVRVTDLDRLSGAEACIRIDAASLTTGNSMRDHTMRVDHLETAKFPTIDFTLRGVADVHRTADEWTFVATGTLSLHGVERQVDLPIRARQDGEAVRLTGSVPLRMSDYGIRIPRFLLLSVEDQVVVSFDVLARPASGG